MDKGKVQVTQHDLGGEMEVLGELLQVFRGKSQWEVVQWAKDP